MSTQHELLIRAARATDVAELARLRWDSRADEHGRSSRDAFVHECETWLRERIACHRWFMAVAECGPGLIGCMFLQCVENVPAPGESHRAWGYVTNSFVDPTRRGQRVGEQLLQRLIQVARDRTLEFLIVWPSEAAVTFYTRAGFRPVSSVHVGPDDEPPLELRLSSAGSNAP